jgi:homoaconitase/3-isopropylmalate dehydratase large subunit
MGMTIAEKILARAAGRDSVAPGEIVLLWIAGRFGSHANQNLELGGPAMATLGLDARRTLSTMAAEVSAEFALWEPDDTLLEHVRSRTDRPFSPTSPDPDARYLDVRRIELDAIGPYVALPNSVAGNTVPVGELGCTVKLDQCFVGSCANGTLEDLAIVAACSSTYCQRGGSSHSSKRRAFSSPNERGGSGYERGM